MFQSTSFIGRGENRERTEAGGLRLGRGWRLHGQWGAPGGWWGGESSVGGLVDLLAAGDDPAILHLLHNGARSGWSRLQETSSRGEWGAQPQLAPAP